MKRVNNKGFAISVLIYSLATIALLTLLLILGTLSGMRKNESSLAEAVKEELNVAGRMGNIFSDTTKILRYKVPITATYNFKLWGASGGSPGSNNTGGLGGYVEFNRTLDAGKVVYMVVGAMGECPTNHEENFGNSFTTGGFGHCSNSLGVTVCGCNGGGATIVLLGDDTNVPASIDEIRTTYSSSILGVAGGGGGAGILSSASAGHATATGEGVVNRTYTVAGGEVPEANVAGTSASCSGSTNIAGKLNVAGNIGAGSKLTGGTISSHYYKWPGTSFGAEADGYAGAGGGGGYYGGGASSGSYTGAGGGCNYVASGGVMNLGGAANQPKKDNPEELTAQYEEKFGNGQIIITRE